MRTPKQDLEAMAASSEIESLIRTVRGRKVLLDADLARIYGVPTKALNQAVRRNPDKFPEDFRFQLTAEEMEDVMRSQIVTASKEREADNRSQIASGSSEGKANRSRFVTGSQKHRDPRFLPYAFTEHGAIMAANVLNSPAAVRLSVYVVRAFVQMRGLLGGTRELAQQLAALDRKLTGRLDGHEVAIVEVLHRIMTLIDPPPAPPVPPRRRIGFGAARAARSGSADLNAEPRRSSG